MLSISTRAARCGVGVNGVSSSNTASTSSPRARVPTMLEPEVWMKRLAGAGERLDHRLGGAAVAGIGGVDGDVGRKRGCGEHLGVVERAGDRRDAALPPAPPRFRPSAPAR